MKVPEFSGVTSWDQYRQMFDAIVHSNGRDDATVALQLLFSEGGHIECRPQRASRAGLVRALTEHYGSPGRLVDCRRQFENGSV